MGADNVLGAPDNRGHCDQDTLFQVQQHYDVGEHAVVGMPAAATVESAGEPLWSSMTMPLLAARAADVNGCQRTEGDGV